MVSEEADSNKTQNTSLERQFLEQKQRGRCMNEEDTDHLSLCVCMHSVMSDI